jgi:hypothetical protein
MNKKTRLVSFLSLIVTITLWNLSDVSGELNAEESLPCRSMLDEYRRDRKTQENRVVAAIHKVIVAIEETKEETTAVRNASWSIQQEIRNISAGLVDFIQKTYFPLDAIEDSNIKRLPGKTRKLKAPFIQNDFQILPTREECFRFCFEKSLNDVCQISHEIFGSNGFKCSISSARSKYIKEFPGRYVEVKNDRATTTIYEIYYYDVGDVLPSARPILFYPLDNVSKNTNLGKLGSMKYSLDMGPTTPRYECDAPFSKHKFLRFSPRDKFLIQIPNVGSIPFNNPQHFTMIVWIKKMNANQQAPLIEATSSNHTVIEWWLWIHDKANKLHPLFARRDGLKSDTLKIHEWNVIAFRVNDNTLDLFVNHNKVSSITVTGNIRSFGDRIYIGKRVGNPNQWGWTDQMFDGCMANLMIFTSALTDAEIVQYGKMQSDPHF